MAPKGEHSSRHASDVLAPASVFETFASRPAGPLRLGALHITLMAYDPREFNLPPATREMTLLLMPEADVQVRANGVAHICRAGGGIVLPLRRRWTIMAEGVSDTQGERAVSCLTLMMPDVFLAFAVPQGVAQGVTGDEVPIGAIRRTVANLLEVDPPLNEYEAMLAAGAIRDMLAAAFLSSATANQAGAMRGAGLLDRAIQHIDAHPTQDFTVASLCAALGCSRSALYRAVEPVGGIAELVVRRRLAQIHARLLDPHETRSIGEIAAEHGFPGAAQFSRRFRHVFGLSARQARAQSMILP